MISIFNYLNYGVAKPNPIEFTSAMTPITIGAIADRNDQRYNLHLQQYHEYASETFAHVRSVFKACP
ncbi:hypothetical protein J2S21_001203 [Peribacillus cavernae]|nr:hypothetical protein [Peribacillus cavernae]